ncbi:hypothetical protein [Streptomyces violascens]
MYKTLDTHRERTLLPPAGDDHTGPVVDACLRVLSRLLELMGNDTID